jgi:hypothetical protein
MKLDADEKRLLDSVERGEWKRAPRQGSLTVDSASAVTDARRPCHASQLFRLFQQCHQDFRGTMRKMVLGGSNPTMSRIILAAVACRAARMVRRAKVRHRCRLACSASIAGAEGDAYLRARPDRE